MRHPDKPALDAERLQLDEPLQLDLSVITAEGAGEDGALRLAGAQIGDQLTLRGATLRNSAGPALYASRLQTHGNVILDEGFTAEGANEHGALRLHSARIGGHLILSGATVRNSAGSALPASGLQTGGNVFLDAGFTAEGAASVARSACLVRLSAACSS